MEDEEEPFSLSESSDSGEEFSSADDSDSQEDEEDLNDDVSEVNQPSTGPHGPASDEDRKSKNVDALLRCTLSLISVFRNGAFVPLNFIFRVLR